jgi:hypothetical protein
LREKSEVALDGRDTFGRFERVLAGYPKERSRRFNFKLAAMSGWIRERLRELDIEPVQKEG